MNKLLENISLNLLQFKDFHNTEFILDLDGCAVDNVLRYKIPSNEEEFRSEILKQNWNSNWIDFVRLLTDIGFKLSIYTGRKENLKDFTEDYLIKNGIKIKIYYFPNEFNHDKHYKDFKLRSIENHIINSKSNNIYIIDDDVNILFSLFLDYQIDNISFNKMHLIYYEIFMEKEYLVVIK